MVVWLIGLSGAGKTTVGKELRNQIVDLGHNCVLLDGDIIREIFANDLGHSIADRKRNADRICQLCKHLSSQGINVVCAILSIFHESQAWNRKNMNDYYEVFIDAPLELVKKRDVKGIYKKVERGEISSVAGVDLEFPVPKSPNLILQNDFTEDVSSMAKSILDKIKQGLY
ncbi:MAG: adenylyl-sulfate kinase [Bdellovibrionota bacterium]